MASNKISISSKQITKRSKPYIIAEIGSNFNQNLEIAYKLIDVAAEAKADAVKFQLFKAANLYPNKDGLYDIFKSIELNYSWVPKLIKYSKSKNIEFLASAFDIESVDILEENSIHAHKIASSETTNLAFVRYVASKGKPILISTGMCDKIDVIEAINICKEVGNEDYILFQCGSMYPLPHNQSNLKVISSYQKQFNCIVGLSDHTEDNIAALTAVGLGATVFEKHITLDKNMDGPDHSYAMEPENFKNFCQSINISFEALGSNNKEMLIEEKKNGRREGLYANRDIPKDSIISINDITLKRPALGLRARYFTNIIGVKTKVELKKDEPIEWNKLDI